MEITEKLLLDHYAGLSNFLNCISDLPDGARIFWNYRRGRDTDGYNPVCCERADAAEISLEADRNGIIALDPAQKDHPALAKMAKDTARILGDEI